MSYMWKYAENWTNSCKVAQMKTGIVTFSADSSPYKCLSKTKTLQNAVRKCDVKEEKPLFLESAPQN